MLKWIPSHEVYQWSSEVYYGSSREFARLGSNAAGERLRAGLMFIDYACTATLLVVTAHECDISRLFSSVCSKAICEFLGWLITNLDMLHWSPRFLIRVTMEAHALGRD